MISTEQIFNIKSDGEFEALALDIFKFQFENNPVYRSFCDLLYKHPSDVKTLRDIPFLPIQFFKSHKVVSKSSTPERIFTSSGTTGSTTSNHFVSDISLYQKSYLEGFKQVYGPIEDYVILALLPSYLEREGSSLIYMVNDLIAKSNHSESGFYLHNYNEFAKTLKSLEVKEQKTLLIGVSFALLDLIENYTISFEQTIIMETGGMKGRRKELIRKELHHQFKNRLWSRPNS